MESTTPSPELPEEIFNITEPLIILQDCNEDCNEYLLQNQKQMIYNLIATNLNNDWQKFARNLNIKYSKIDEIDCENITIYQKIKNILEIYENENFNSNSYVFDLNNALENVNFNLVKEINQYLTRNS